MATLIVLFPHKGDDGVRYEPGQHREVLDHLVEAYLRPDGNLDLYALFEPVKIKPTAPIYNPVKGESVGGLTKLDGPPESEAPAPKLSKKK